MERIKKPDTASSCSRKLRMIPMLMIIVTMVIQSCTTDPNQLLPTQQVDQLPIGKAGDSLSYKRAARYYQLDSIEPAMDHAYLARSYAISTSNQEMLIRTNQLLGYMYIYLSDYEKSLELFMEALQMARQRPESHILVVALHGLARTHILMKEPDKSVKLLLEAVQVAERLNLVRETGKIHLELGNAYVELKDFEAGLFQNTTALNYAENSGDTLSMIYILNNFGNAYIKMSLPDSAEVYLERSLDLNRLRGDAQAMAATLGNLGEVYTQQGKYDLAIDYILQSLEISTRQGFKVFTKDNYLMLSNALELKGDLAGALRYYQLYTAMGDSLYNEDKNRAIEAIVSRFTREEKDHQIQRLQQQAKTRSALLKVTIAAIGLFLITVVLLVIALRLRIKLHAREKRQLDEAINQKDRELVSLVMQGAQKRKMLEEIEKTVDKYSAAGDQGLIGYADELKQKIKSTHDIDHEWETLKTHFERVHPEFFRILQKRHPELSQHDLKLCAYTKINLTTKEIARILNISDRSVQTARYRIKKKMELPQSTDLVTYIAEI